MSTGKCSVTDHQAGIDRAALLAQQEAERAARLRRMADANRQVETAHACYSGLQNRLHEGQGHYPTDLSFSMPALPLPSGAGDDPAAVEHYAATLQATLARIEQELERALAAARAAHEDRLARQAAWQELHAYGAALQLAGAASSQAAQALGETNTVSALTAPPPAADLATLHAHIQRQRQQLDEERGRLAAMRRRAQERARQYENSGAAITTQSAAGALSIYHSERAKAEHEAALEVIAACLREFGWTNADVPAPLAQQMEQVDTRAGAERVTGLLRLHQDRQQGQRQARNLLLQPPPYFDHSLQQAWTAFAEKIQTIATGNANWDGNLVYEHHALHQRANALMQAEYQISQLRQRAAESGLDVVDSEGLVTLNLRGLAQGYSYEVRQLGQKNGQIATHFQLVAGSGIPTTSDDIASHAGCQQLKAILPAVAELYEADDMLETSASVPATQASPATAPPLRKKRRVTNVKKKAFAVG